MAFFKSEGFETYSTLAEVSTVWTSLGTNLSFNGARTGDRGLVTQGIRMDLGAEASATMIAAGGFRSLTDSAFDMIRFLGDSGATEHIVIRRAAGGAVAIDRGATEIAITAAGVFPLGTSFFEVKVVLHDSTGSVEVRKEGVAIPILTFSGDTKNGGTNPTIDSVAYHGLYDTDNGGIDDLYISNAGGAAPYNDFLGNIRLWPLSPDGNGASSQFVGSDGNSTNNWDHVNDDPASASAMDDYVESNTVGAIDLYTYSNIPQSSGTIYGINVATLAKVTDPSGKQFRPVIRTNGVNYTGADVQPGLVASVTREHWAVNPNTGLAWTFAEINDIQAGEEVRA